MDLKHLVIASLLIVGLIYINLEIGIIPWNLVTPIAVITGAAGLLYYVDISSFKKPELHNAFQHINEKLEEMDDYRKFEPDRRKWRQRTRLHDINGKEKKFVGIVGDEYNPGDSPTNTIRVVWNWTDNELWDYDDDVTNPEIKQDPLADIKRKLTVEGYKTRSRKDRNRGPTINVNPPRNWDNNEAREDARRKGEEH